jgi:hypothetical protein
MNSRAIITRYKGCLFRSRNEARWAVFFETLGLAWTYELEGFRIPNYTGYLPDFYVEPWKAWVEIKFEAPTVEERTSCRQHLEAQGEYRRPLPRLHQRRAP